MEVNVKDHGAKGDGETDDTEAVQRAIDEAEAGGVNVHFPAGNYAFKGCVFAWSETVATVKD